MTLRARIAAAAGLAVAVAVVSAAVGLYLAVRSDLRGQIDKSLSARARELVSGAVPPAARHTAGGRWQNRQTTVDREPARFFAGAGAPTAPGFPRAVQPARFGGASGYVEFISPPGAVQVPGGQSSSPSIAPDAAEQGDRGQRARRTR